MKNSFALILAITVSFLGICHGADGFKAGAINLNMPSENLKARLPDTQLLSRYVKEIETACNEYFKKEAKPAPPFHLMIAVKPGKVARVWFVVSDPNENARLAPLKQKLESMPAMEVVKGPVAFAISDEDTANNEEIRQGPPVPEEWMKIIDQSEEELVMPDGVLAILWPDSAEDKAAAKASPKGESEKEK